MSKLRSTRETNLVNHTIPCVSCIIDDDMNLSIAEICSLLYKVTDVLIVEHVSRHCQRLATGAVDLVGDLLCLR